MKTKQQLFEDKVRRIVKEELMKEENSELPIEQVAKNLKKTKIPDLYGYIELDDIVLFLGKSKVFKAKKASKYGNNLTGYGHYDDIIFIK